MVATVSNLSSASATSEYFRSEGGYYVEEGDGSDELRAKREEHREASAWHGEGAEALGLKPGARVAAGKFEKLLRGHVLGTDIRLGRMRDGQHEHRPGFDITFSAPKSVSLAALLPTAERPRGDRAVIRAHDAAVRATLDWIEKTMLQTRGWDPETGTRPRESAPSMVAATFRHIASRNLDPQLHTHAVIANMTRDAKGKWKSVEPAALHRNARLIGAYYRNELSRRLIERGYSVLPAMAGRVPSFELAGYGKELCDAFSTRRRDILAHLEEKGLPYSSRAAQVAALAGRRDKAEPVRAVLQRHWAGRAKALGFDTARSLSMSREPAELAAAPSALEIVDRGMRHLEERQSVFAAGELEAFALAHSPGRHSIGEIREAVDWMVRDGHLVEATLRRTDRAFVTDRALKAERATIAMMKAGKGQGKALAREETVTAHLVGSILTEGQREAVATILLARDRIVGVQGRAGTGKTTMLREVRALAGGRQVVGLAPSAAAARVLERETGIHARTLQWFLTRCQGAAGGGAERKLRETFGGSVLVLDEASMVSTDQMRDLMRIADGLGVARLVLVGDTRQLRAVDAGQPFRQLQQAGMTTATMDDILRQKNPALKDAVLAALAGEPGAAVEMLGNDLLEVGHDELAAKAAETWLALDREARAGTLLLAPTHALREEINRTVREALADEGVLRGKVLTIDRLVNLGMTRAERADVRNYRDGDEVVFNQDLVNYRLRKDEILTVTGTDRDRVELLHPDGGLRRIRPSGPIRYRYDVYETREIEIRAGDRIRWTRNDRERTLINGERAEVLEIARGRVRLALEDGRTISLREDDPQLRHIDHAWSATVHGAQGSTAEGVIAVLDSSHRALTDQSTFYVEISRARRNAVVLTDNLDQLVEVLESNTGERATAWEAVGEEHVEPDAERLAAVLREKAPVWTPRPEWEALEARARDLGTVLFLVEGYGPLIGRTRMLADTPDLPAQVREVVDGLLAYDRACREHGRAAGEFVGLLEAHARKRRGLEETAEAERRAVAGLDGYAAWRGMTDRLADNAAAVIAAVDDRVAGAADAIMERINDLGRLTELDDAALAFETLRIALDGLVAAAGTIPFYCEGHGELVGRARELVPLTAPDTYMREAAQTVIDDHRTCERRHEEIATLRAEAAACLADRAGLEREAGERPPAGLDGYAAWSARCDGAAERWREMRDDPETWQPHLDRRGEDAAQIAADLNRLADLRELDAAWSGLLDMRLAIAEEARALDRDAFDLDGWCELVERAATLADWPDVPEPAAEAARRVLEYDGRCRTVRDFAAGTAEHGERRETLEQETAVRREEYPDTSIVDLPGYAPLSAFAKELTQTGQTIRDDMPAYGPHLDRLPGGGEGFAMALGGLDWHGPLDRFAGVTERIAAAREIAAERGILVFHAPGYGAAIEDAKDLAEERALEEEAARARLQAELDAHAARQAEWARIEQLLRHLDGIEREYQRLEREAEREDVALDRMPDWQDWNASHGEFVLAAQAALADETLSEHWSSRPEVRERIEQGMAGMFESRTVDVQEMTPVVGRGEDLREDVSLDSAALAEDYPVRCRRDFIVGDVLCWTEPAPSDRLPGDPVPQGTLNREVRFEAELVGRSASLDERDDECTLEIIRRSDAGLCGTATVPFSMLAGAGCMRPFWDDEEDRRQEAEAQWKELQLERQLLLEQQQIEWVQVMTWSSR